MLLWGFVRGALVLWVSLTLVFFALRVLPGDALTAVDSASSAAVREQQRDALGLNEPLPQQYSNYILNLLQGDFGHSLVTSETVSSMILVRLGPTLALGIGSFGIAIAVGCTLAVAALGRGLIGTIASGLIVLSQAVPYYVTALLVLYVFSLRLNLLPASGSRTPLHLILPCSVLGFHAASSIAHVLRSNLHAAYTAPYMLTAYAKGLPPIDRFEHALRVALLPTLPVIAVQAGFLLSGTVVIEVLFVRRGLGNLLLQSVLERDYPVVQALAILGALFYLLALAASDLLRRQMDPRLA